MYAKTINLLCKGNKVFVKYQAQGEDLTPTPSPLRAPLNELFNSSTLSRLLHLIYHLSNLQ